MLQALGWEFGHQGPINKCDNLPSAKYPCFRPATMLVGGGNLGALSYEGSVTAVFYLPHCKSIHPAISSCGTFPFLAFCPAQSLSCNELQPSLSRASFRTARSPQQARSHAVSAARTGFCCTLCVHRYSAYLVQSTLHKMGVNAAFHSKC